MKPIGSRTEIGPMSAGGGGCTHPGEQIERAGEVAARLPEDLLDFGVRIGHEIGDAGSAIVPGSGGRAAPTAPPRRRRRHDWRRQAVAGPEWQVGMVAMAPTYTGFANFPDAQFAQGVFMIARPDIQRQTAAPPAGRRARRPRCADHLRADGHDVAVARSTAEALSCSPG